MKFTLNKKFHLGHPTAKSYHKTDRRLLKDRSFLPMMPQSVVDDILRGFTFGSSNK